MFILFLVFIIILFLLKILLKILKSTVSLAFKLLSSGLFIVIAIIAFAVSRTM
ncbi:MAG: hypothetical protein K6B38_12520 [Ruminococcus sp.]|nr:hypothetical protein [Ruminococcus sp.]